MEGEAEVCSTSGFEWLGDSIESLAEDGMDQGWAAGSELRANRPVMRRILRLGMGGFEGAVVGGEGPVAGDVVGVVEFAVEVERGGFVGFFGMDVEDHEQMTVLEGTADGGFLPGAGDVAVGVDGELGFELAIATLGVEDEAPFAVDALVLGCRGWVVLRGWSWRRGTSRSRTAARAGR